jgi:hypothetical protein
MVTAERSRIWSVPESQIVVATTRPRHEIVQLGLPAELRTALPAETKVDWVVQTLSEHDRAEMGSELLRAATHACRTAQLEGLAEAILSWEATAEEIEDSRTQSGTCGNDTAGEPVSFEELERRLRGNG